MLHEIGSRLDYLGFQAIRPAPALQPYVQCYWMMHCDLPPGIYREELLHPSGGSGMMFNFGETLAIDGNHFPQQGFFNGTPVTSRLGLHGKIEAIGVRFQPGGAYPFLQQPLHYLIGSRIQVDELDQGSISELYARIFDAPTLTDKIKLLERWLLKQLREGSSLAPMVPPSLAMIRQTRGKLSIQTLADKLYLSQRQLERLYKEQVGITPKTYARLMRVEHAREALKESNVHSVAAVGYDVGFYDQSHFVKEFTAITGITPSLYLQRIRERGARKPAVE